MMPLLPEDRDHLRSGMAPLREQLREARVLVTGGTGFWGRWVLAALLETEAEAVVLTRDPDGFAARHPLLANHPSIRLHRGDVRDFPAPAERLTHLLHLAAEPDGPRYRTHGLDLLETHGAGTRHAVEVAAACGATRALVGSSGAVYGSLPTDLSAVSESYGGAPDPLDVRSIYGTGKRLAELEATVAGRATGVEAVVARGFAFIGPGLPLDGPFAAGNFLRDALNAGPIFVGGDGTPVRTYLYAADLAIWLWTLLLNGEAGRAYNVGSDENVTIGELAARIASLAACSVNIAGQPTPASRYVPDITRASALGLTARIGLNEALRRTFRWHRREAAP